MDWTATAPEFAWDGSWRDIYILNTSLNDWQRVLDSLRDHSPTPKFFVDGRPTALPPSIQAVFERRNECGPLIEVKVGRVSLNCHFFDAGEVEFDFDPREVRGEEELLSITAFMSKVANAAGKPAILTHENARDAVIFSVEPSA